MRERVDRLLADVTSHLNDGRRGERLRSGVHVTIVGAPNSGKSSLLNILCKTKMKQNSPPPPLFLDFISLSFISNLQINFNAFCSSPGQRPAAIVSPLAGTTRDVLESALDIHGYPIVVRYIIIVV